MDYQGLKLKLVPAHCGCQGCYFDSHPGCDVDHYIDVKGLPIPDPSLWDCGSDTDSFIFVEENENV